MHSNKSSSSPARSSSSVRDIVLYINSDNVDKIYSSDHEFFSAARFRVWLEQISCMLLLPSHRRVPDFDSTNASSGSFNGPLVQFSVATSPDQKSIDLSRFLHAQIVAFFQDNNNSRNNSRNNSDNEDEDADVRRNKRDDQAGSKNLVRVAPNVACHRSLSGFQKPRVISLADIDPTAAAAGAAVANTPVSSPVQKRNSNSKTGSSAAADGATCSMESAMTSRGTQRLARVQTYGRRPSSLEHKADAADRIADFAFMLEACMDVTKISDLVFELDGEDDDKKKRQLHRDPESDSSDDEVLEGAAAAAAAGGDGVSTRIPMLGSSMTLRQVVIVVCNEFAFQVIARKKEVMTVATAAEAFLWTRNTNQQRWHSPALWRDRTGASLVAGDQAVVASSITKKEATSAATAAASSAPGSPCIIIIGNNQQQHHSVMENPLLNMTETEISMQFQEEESRIFNETMSNKLKGDGNNNNDNHNNNNGSKCNISILPDDEVDFSVDLTLGSPSPAPNTNSNNNNNSAMKNIATPTGKVVMQKQAEEQVAAPLSLAREETAAAARATTAVARGPSSAVLAALEEIAAKESSVEQELHSIEEQHQQQQQQQQQQRPRTLSISFAGPEKLSRTVDNVAVIALNNSNNNNNSNGGDASTQLPFVTAAAVSRVVSSPPLTAKCKPLTGAESLAPFAPEANDGASTVPHSARSTAASAFGSNSTNKSIPSYAAPLSRSLRSSTPTKNNGDLSSRSSACGHGGAGFGALSLRSSSSNSTGSNSNGAAGAAAAVGATALPRFVTGRAPLSQQRNLNNDKNNLSDEALQRRRAALCPVNLGPKASEAEACSRLYKQGATALKRRSALEQQENERRREKEEEELRRARHVHPTVSMFHKDHKEGMQAAKKIVAAMRADPDSDEALVLIPNIPDKIPGKEVKSLLSRLVPPGPKVAKRFQQQQQQNGGVGGSSNNSSNNNSRGATPRNASSGASSARSGSGSGAPAWRHGGVAGAQSASGGGCPASNSGNSRRSTPLNTSRHPSSATSSSNDGARVRSSRGAAVVAEKNGAVVRNTSIPITERLYINRNSSREAQARQQERFDEREINAIIAQRKVGNPTWAKMVRKDETIEMQYRRRLMKARVEERRMLEERGSKMARADPRFAEGLSSLAAF